MTQHEDRFKSFKFQTNCAVAPGDPNLNELCIDSKRYKTY